MRIHFNQSSKVVRLKTKYLVSSFAFPSATCARHLKQVPPSLKKPAIEECKHCNHLCISPLNNVSLRNKRNALLRGNVLLETFCISFYWMKQVSQVWNTFCISSQWKNIGAHLLFLKKNINKCHLLIYSMKINFYRASGYQTCPIEKKYVMIIFFFFLYLSSFLQF